MTQNQLAYLKYEEDVRANKEKEAAARTQASAAKKQADVAEAKLYETSILGNKLPLPGLLYGTGGQGIDVTSKRSSDGRIKPISTIGDLLANSFKQNII